MEQATLTIQRNLLSGKKTFYNELFRSYKDGNNLNIHIQALDDSESFGEIRFIEDKNGVFFEHLPSGEDHFKNQLCFPGNIPPEWLFCFSYQEMKVIGFDMGVFEAETTVELALARLQWVDIDYNHPLSQEKNKLYIWLKENARMDDRIRLCSEWIYYHPEGKYDYQFVRKDINNRILKLKSSISCSHWTNRKQVS